MFTRLKDFLQGMIVGAAQILPGVSGSSLALAMGIYNLMIDTLYNLGVLAADLALLPLRRHRIKTDFRLINWKWLIAFGLGILFAIIALANVLSELFASYPTILYAFFLGLAIAAALLLARQIKFTLVQTLIVFGVAAVVLVLVYKSFTSGQTSLISVTEYTAAFMLFGGFITAAGSVLPGLGGSFLLLMLGGYDHVVGLVKALSRFNIDSNGLVQLVFFGIGMLLGLGLTLIALRWAMKSFATHVTAAMLGLVIGGLPILWPWVQVVSGTDPESYPRVLPWELGMNENAGIIYALAIGLLIVYLLHRRSKTI
jgi:putative membrane protein